MRRDVLSVLCFVLLSGCAQDQREIAVLGREWYRIKLPEEIVQKAGIEPNSYQYFRFTLDNQRLWMFEPETDGVPFLICMADGTPVLSLQHYWGCEDLLKVSSKGKTMLVMSVLAYRNEPLIQLIGFKEDRSMYCLAALGGEEWRTRGALDFRVEGNRIVIAGIDPERFSVGEATVEYLSKMDMQISLVK